MAFTSAQTMWAAIVLFFMSLFMSLTFILVGGTVLDAVHYGFEAAGIFDLPGIWGDLTLYNFVTALYYGFWILVPIIMFIFAAIAVYHKYVLDDRLDEGRLMPPSGNV